MDKIYDCCFGLASNRRCTTDPKDRACQKCTIRLKMALMRAGHNKI